MGHGSDGDLEGDRRCSRGAGRSCVSTELARALRRQACTDKVCSHLLCRCKTEDFSTSGHSVFLASKRSGGGEHWDDNSWQLVYLTASTHITKPQIRKCVSVDHEARLYGNQTLILGLPVASMSSARHQKRVSPSPPRRKGPGRTEKQTLNQNLVASAAERPLLKCLSTPHMGGNRHEGTCFPATLCQHCAPLPARIRLRGVTTSLKSRFRPESPN